ncbi:ABC transporter substrate-binding protein [Archaeoglobales archaeon]|nr:MAG: ABC transporter substrate-binding protein [Archaeoglobales archaeon]
MKLIVAHTPDADDAFMFYAMAHGKVKCELKIEHLIEDIESLNKKAFDGKLDVTALSAHAYAYLHEKYRILSVGASVGDGYGPIVVSKQKVELNGKKIAIPGKYTTANLLLNLALDDFKAIEMRFDEIIDAVKSGIVDAGLLIHEGQITYEKHGLKMLLDLWEWWNDLTKLPLPLGINVIKRSMPIEVQREFLRVMRESIGYALNNVDEAINYAMKYSRGLDEETTKKFALMYVNEYTYEMPNSVVKALKLLYEMGKEKNLIEMPKLDVLF